MIPGIIIPGIIISGILVSGGAAGGAAARGTAAGVIISGNVISRDIFGLGGGRRFGFGRRFRRTGFSAGFPVLIQQGKNGGEGRGLGGEDPFFGCLCFRQSGIVSFSGGLFLHRDIEGALISLFVRLCSRKGAAERQRRA